MSNCISNIACSRFYTYCVSKDAAVDTVRDAVAVKYAPGSRQVEAAADGAAALAGVVICDNQPKTTFNSAGDSVSVVKDGAYPFLAGAAIAAGDTVIADGAGGVIPGAGHIVGVAECDVAAGEYVVVDIRLIHV